MKYLVMKPTIKLIFIIPIVLVFISCNDLLNEDPRSEISPDSFYDSSEEAITGVNGVYAGLYDAFGQSYFDPSSNGTDVSYARSNREDLAHNAYTLSSTNIGPGMNEYWLNMYKAVGDANMVINRVSGAENISQEIKDRVIGEAKFLRAIFYFQMNKFWGGVPIWTEELDINEVSELPRSTTEEVRAQIVTDLTDAISKLPDTYSSAEVGRATKGAARALLAKVYLFMEDWQNARDQALEVVNSGSYELLPSYSEVFALDNEFNDEIIFSVDHKVDVPPGEFRHEWFELRGSEGIEGLSGFSNFLPPFWYANSFDEDDERLGSVVIFEYEGTSLSRPYYGPKFYDINASNFNGGRNFIVMRYADVLLMLAEAENELNGPTQQAYNSINKVRQRAGVEPLFGLSQQQLREAIRLERAKELGGEGHRRWDLNRWGILVESVQKVAENNPRGAENVRPHHMLYPIPPVEINKNPNLEQNEGYGGN